MAQESLFQKVVIDNTYIDALISDPATRQAFQGCLDLVAKAPAGRPCGKCKKAATKDATYYNQAKLCLAQLPDARKQELKQLLRAKQAQVVVNLGGRTKTLVF